MTGAATAALILAARDAGANDFLRKPYSMNGLVGRLEVVTLRERDWIEGIGYIGPDRRRFNSEDYDGPLRRRDDGLATPYQQKINQAIKIIRAAVAASDTDPEQAMRAMITQATTLQEIPRDLNLIMAASEFHRHLARTLQAGGKLTRADAELWASPILKFLIEDGQSRASAAA